VLSTSTITSSTSSARRKKGTTSKVAEYEVHGVQHFLIRRADQPLRKIYDNEILRRYRFSVRR